MIPFYLFFSFFPFMKVLLGLNLPFPHLAHISVWHRMGHVNCRTSDVYQSNPGSPFPHLFPCNLFSPTGPSPHNSPAASLRVIYICRVTHQLVHLRKKPEHLEPIRRASHPTQGRPEIRIRLGSLELRISSFTSYAAICTVLCIIVLCSRCTFI